MYAALRHFGRTEDKNLRWQTLSLTHRTESRTQRCVIWVAHNTAAHTVITRGSSHPVSLIHSLSPLTLTLTVNHTARIASSGIDSVEIQ